MPLGPSAADPYRRKLALGSENQDTDYSGLGINNTRAEAAAKARMLKDRFNAAQKAFIREKQLGTIKFGSAEDLAGRSGLRSVADEASAYENAARPAQRVFTPEQNAQNAMTISEQARTLTGRPMYSQADAAALGQRASARQAALSRRDDMRAGELFQLARKIGEPRERYEQIDQQMNTFADEERKRMFDNARLNNDLINAQRNHELKVINNKSTTDYTDQMNEAKLKQIHADIESKVKRGEIERQQADDEHKQAEAQYGLMQDKIAENRLISPGRVAREIAQNKYAAEHVGNTLEDELKNTLLRKQVSNLTDPFSPEEITKRRQRQEDITGLYGVGNQQLQNVMSQDIPAVNKIMSDITGKGRVVGSEESLPAINSLHDYVQNLAQAASVGGENLPAIQQSAQAILSSLGRTTPSGTYEPGKSLFRRVSENPLAQIALPSFQRGELLDRAFGVTKNQDELTKLSVEKLNEIRRILMSIAGQRTATPQQGRLLQPAASVSAPSAKSPFFSNLQ